MRYLIVWIYILVIKWIENLVKKLIHCCHGVDNMVHGFGTLRPVTGLSACVSNDFYIRIILYHPLLSSSELIFGEIYANLANSEIIIHRNWKILLQRYPKQRQKFFAYNFCLHNHIEMVFQDNPTSIFHLNYDASHFFCCYDVIQHWLIL